MLPSVGLAAPSSGRPAAARSRAGAPAAASPAAEAALRRRAAARPGARAARGWAAPAAAGALALALSVGAALGGAGAARAENELAEIAGGKFDPSFVDKECFVNSCSGQSKACLDNRDCLKGMTCTAKCMGDNACITGCFAKFGNAEMNSLLKCSIEDHECVKIAVLPAGPEGPLAASAGSDAGNGQRLEITPPRGTLVKNFEPASLEGTWYKVMGWNSNYDCFDNQANTFSRLGGAGGSGGAAGTAGAGAGGAAAPLSPRARRSRARCSSTSTSRCRASAARAPTLYRQNLQEKIVFDKANPLRHAHRGPDVWAHVLGELERHRQNDASNPAEPPFKFVYYNGRTRQNTYEARCTRARRRSRPRRWPRCTASRARRMVPDNFCKIRNTGFEASLPAQAASRARRRCPRTSASTRPRPRRRRMRRSRASPTAARAPRRARGGRRAGAGPRGRADDRGVREGHLHRGGRVPRGSALVSGLDVLAAAEGGLVVATRR